MAPGPTGGRDTARRGSKDPLDWSNSLKEIAGLLPISEPQNGRGITKKETLVHMLRYFDFLQGKIQSLQSRLPLHCLPQDPPDTGSESEEYPPSEPCSPPLTTLKSKRKYIRKRPAPTTEVQAEVQDKRWKPDQEEASGKRGLTQDQSPLMWGGMHTDWSELQPAGRRGELSLYDSDSLPSSMDSALSLSQPLEGSSGILWSPSQLQGGHCSVCEDQTGSESSPGSTVFHTPPTGPGSLLLKERVLRIIPSSGGRREPLPSPAATPRRPPLLLPWLGTGPSLNLSPSLLTSPARGLSHCLLLPEGQEELQALFEDVWVTPKTSSSRVSGRPNHDPTDSPSEGEAAVRRGSGGWLSSQSEGEEGDVTWTPNQQVPLKKASAGRRRRRAKATRGLPRALPTQKKKCVNGFIMFCRINRKTYLRTHPGTPSTVVTKELASLWHVMPKQERRVYCLKARHFSRQQNRNVKSEEVEGEEEEDGGEDCVPSPLHMLLAQRDLCAAARGGP